MESSNQMKTTEEKMSKDALNEAYQLAQHGMAEMKSDIHQVLKTVYPKAFKNHKIGRMLGIYQGHVRHEGHVSRTLLEIMKSEGTIEQNKEDKIWRMKLPEDLSK